MVDERDPVALHPGHSGPSPLGTREGLENPRRHFLVVATSLIAGVGVIGAAVPFVRSMLPSVRARAQGGTVEVDSTKLDPGQQVTVAWRGRPIWILRRTESMLQRLNGLTGAGVLRDPESEEPQQPDYVHPIWRSQKPEILVAVALCTHLGCIPTFRPEVGAEDLGSDWPGGYFCPCHGSKFDFAGRVYKDVPAPLNLAIPPYRLEPDGLVVIGEAPEEAEHALPKDHHHRADGQARGC